MPSPFPGMDPYIEQEEWSDFHGAFIFALRGQLAPLLRPRYLVRAEQRVYLERHFGEPAAIRPDVHLARAETARPAARRSAANPATLEPELFDIPQAEEQQEHFLVVRDRRRREVVTVVELLSPANKAPGADGYREYYDKREDLLRRRVHLVEIDLLRGGRRPASVQPLAPATDYCAFVHRVPLRPRAEVYQWGLRDPLPTIPLPLAEGDADAPLDLQAAFAEAYDGGQYDLGLDYALPLRPPPRKRDASWIKQRVSRRR